MKISNKIIQSITDLSKSNPSLSIKDCCQKLGYKHTTIYNWHKNFKDKKWKAGYSKTEDGEPIDEVLVYDFIHCFSFSQNSAKILKKLVVQKCLYNSSCYAKESNFLKSLFKKYPNINFWLNVDFGPPKDTILFFKGKAEQNLHKKYIDFTAKDQYTKFEYKHEPIENKPREKKKKNLWDFY